MQFWRTLHSHADVGDKIPPALLQSLWMLLFVAVGGAASEYLMRRSGGSLFIPLFVLAAAASASAATRVSSFLQPQQPSRVTDEREAAWPRGRDCSPMQSIVNGPSIRLVERGHKSLSCSEH